MPASTSAIQGASVAVVATRRLVVILGVPVDDISTEEAIVRIDEFVRAGRSTRHTHQVVTVNADFVVNALADPETRYILQDASLATADGMPVVWAARALGVRLPERVTGADLVPMLIAQAARNGYSVFFLGGAPGVAARAAEILQERHPDLAVAGVLSPPFVSILEMEHNIVEAIQAAHPDILLVAFGNPKQEKWIAMHRHELRVPVAMGVGGSLDFIAGYTRRAPRWMQQTGLEWLHRMLSNPRRLVRRYVTDFFVFGSFLLRQWWAMRRYGRPPVALPLDEALLVEQYGILRITGSLTIKNLSQFENRTRLLIDQTPYVILDLEHAEFLDSSAIGRLVYFAQQARQKGGELYLAAVPRQIAQILQLLKLDQYLTSVDSIEQALHAQPVTQAMHAAGSDASSTFELDGKTWQVVYTPPRFDGLTANEVHKQCLAALLNSANLILEFSHTIFLSSAGLAVLADLYKKATEKGGQLILTGCRKDVLEVIKLVRFDQFLKVNANLSGQLSTAKRGIDAS